MTSVCSVSQAARPVQRLLERLQGVRQRGPGRWSAKCPAHADRSPSLSVAEGRDGRALVTCWAGCRPEQIVAAVGLTMQDLFADEQPRRPLNAEERRAAARRRREAEAEKALRQAMRRAEAGLAALYRQTNETLAAGGWERIMAGDPGADKLARLAHKLPYWEWLLDRCLAGDFSAFEAAATEVAANADR